MLRSCKYCGRIHDAKFDCGKKPIYKYNTNNRKFRNSKLWRDKAVEIKERDLFLCQCCLHLDGEYMSETLEVHHIVPLKNDWGLRLCNDNLITLCRYHHEKAEKGDIKGETLKRMISPPGL